MAKPTTIYTILDRTGSMANVRQGMIDAFNAFVTEQRAVPGKTRWTMVQFDRWAEDPVVETVFEDVKGKDVPELGSTQAPFEPRGMTPLHDAVGMTLSNVKNTEGQVVVVIVTDGYENASTEWDAKRVKKLVNKLQKKGWQFIFMGADQDAWATGGAMGINATVSVDNTADSYLIGTQTVSDAAAAYRVSGQTVSYTGDVREDKE